MKNVRRVHAWLGVLFAPTIIFFALTGTLQMYGLHDTEAGETPGLIAKAAMVHTHQTASVPTRQARPQLPRAEQPKPAPEAAVAPRPEKPTTLPLKLFFTLMAISLIASSVLGLWIAFTSKRDRGLHLGLLIAGFVLPILLVLI
jgi:hypothetical protein